ncbi:MAG TPA: spore coat U domain-containing protein [Mizugakiibacter sp.]
MHASTVSRNRRITLLALLALGTLLASPLVRAARCTISTSGLSFGVYDPLAGSASTANGSVSLNCRYSGADFLFGFTANVTLSPGLSGSYLARTLRAGAEQLRYNLYIDPSHTSVFGDGSGGTQAVSECFPGLFGGCVGGSGNSPVTIPVYGQMPGSQDVGAGSYADNLVVTVTF